MERRLEPSVQAAGAPTSARRAVEAPAEAVPDNAAIAEVMFKTGMRTKHGLYRQAMREVRAMVRLLGAGLGGAENLGRIISDTGLPLRTNANRDLVAGRATNGESATGGEVTVGFRGRKRQERTTDGQETGGSLATPALDSSITDGLGSDRARAATRGDTDETEANDHQRPSSGLGDGVARICDVVEHDQ